MLRQSLCIICLTEALARFTTNFSDDIHWSLGSIFDSLETSCDSDGVCQKRREVAHAIISMLELWVNSFFVNRRECLERAFCSSNQDAARHGLWAWAVAEIASSTIIRKLPRPIQGSPYQMKNLKLAARVGREGADCALFFTDCPESEIKFLRKAYKWGTEPFIGVEKSEKMLKWAFLRERFSATW